MARWRGVLESLVARRAACVVVHGSELERRFSGLARRVVQVVPLVPDEVGERLRGGAETAKADGRLRVLFVGSLVPQKGVGEVIDAVTGLDGVECRVIGPPADPSVVARLEQAAAAGALRYETYLEWPELREAYVWAHALVLPSHHEGFPRVVYEAAAFGAAPVVTPVGSLPTRLRDGESAVFVPIGDAAALRAALVRLVADRVRVAELAAGARGALRPLFASGNATLQFGELLRAAAASRATDSDDLDRVVGETS
jgi:glycosyltransferase involved in cell wall biosynthesis